MIRMIPEAFQIVIKVCSLIGAMYIKLFKFVFIVYFSYLCITLCMTSIDFLCSVLFPLANKPIHTMQSLIKYIEVQIELEPTLSRVNTNINILTNKIRDHEEAIKELRSENKELKQIIELNIKCKDAEVEIVSNR